MNLWIGNTPDGKPFYLPADLGDKKIALLAQSKKGKTYGLGCLLEELVKAQRPFIATDPASNLWGLRVLPDGTPSGLEVVVVGGPHADIPFDRDAGARMAELLLATPICAVIDLAYENTADVRRFMTAFAGRLMQSKPEIARVIVLEEAPELIPQNAFGIQAQNCKAAVAKLAIIGGNFNYGVIPACQRAATLDKNVLSQCEGLIVMGITHKKDRMTVREWMEAKDIDERAAAAFAELGSLAPGEAWYWNPGEDRFEKFTFRKRETLHPREMQKLGLKSSAVQLGDMHAFVAHAKRELAKTSVPVPPQLVTAAEDIKEMAQNPKLKRILKQANAGVANALAGAQATVKEHQDRISELALENGKLRTSVKTLTAQVQEEKGYRKAAEVALEGARKALRPQFEALAPLFEKPAKGAAPSPAAANGEHWEKWLTLAGKQGCRRMLETLLENRGKDFTYTQLGTMSNVSSKKSTFRNYISWMKRNDLITVDKKVVHLNEA